MRFGETRDPAPTTMEELAPGGLLAKLSRMDVVARRVRGARSGERRSRKRGAGLEFSEHRDYEPGDDLRFVDWNVFARLDRLVTKVFIEEEDLTVALLLDASASMDWGNPNKFLFARRMALCLGGRAPRGSPTACAWSGWVVSSGSGRTSWWFSIVAPLTLASGRTGRWGIGSR